MAKATAYLMLGDSKKALNLFLKINRKEYNHSALYLNWAIGLKMEGQDKKAQRMLSLANRSDFGKDYFNKISKYVEGDK